MLFLKYLDDLEGERAIEAELFGRYKNFIIDEVHHWSRWAVQHQNALTVALIMSRYLVRKISSMIA